MNRKDRFNSNLEKIKNKFNNNIQLVDQTIEYAKAKDNLQWYCKEHDITFETSIHNLTDDRRVYCCPKCFEKQRLINIIKALETKFNEKYN